MKLTNSHKIKRYSYQGKEYTAVSKTELRRKLNITYEQANGIEQLGKPAPGKPRAKKHRSVKTPYGKNRYAPWGIKRKRPKILTCPAISIGKKKAFKNKSMPDNASL